MLTGWMVFRPHYLYFCIICSNLLSLSGLPRCLSGKESTCNAGDLGSIPGSGRSLWEGNGNPLQYSCLQNPKDRSMAGYSPWARKGGGPDLATKQQVSVSSAGCVCVCVCVCVAVLLFCKLFLIPQLLFTHSLFHSKFHIVHDPS